jgi:hypothetical protein
MYMDNKLTLDVIWTMFHDSMDLFQCPPKIGGPNMKSK